MLRSSLCRVRQGRTLEVYRCGLTWSAGWAFSSHVPQSCTGVPRVYPPTTPVCDHIFNGHVNTDVRRQWTCH